MTMGSLAAIYVRLRGMVWRMEGFLQRLLGVWIDETPGGAGFPWSTAEIIQTNYRSNDKIRSNNQDTIPGAFSDFLCPVK